MTPDRAWLKETVFDGIYEDSVITAVYYVNTTKGWNYNWFPPESSTSYNIMAGRYFDTVDAARKDMVNHIHTEDGIEELLKVAYESQ